jgi:hypothetical protein
MAVLRLVSDYTKLKKLQRDGEQSVPHCRGECGYIPELRTNVRRVCDEAGMNSLKPNNGLRL